MEKIDSLKQLKVEQTPGAPSAEYHDTCIQLIQTLRKHQRFQEAESELYELMKMGYDYPRTRMIRGNLLVEQRKFEEALIYLREMVALEDPLKVNYLKLIKNIHMYMRNPSACFQTYAEISQYEDLRGLNVEHMLASAIFSQRIEEALELVSETAAKYEDPLFEKSSRAKVATRTNDWVNAEKYWGEVLELNPEDEWAVFCHIEAVFRQHRFEEAQAMIDALLEKNPNCKPALQAKVYTSRMLYFRKEAVETGEKLLELYPDDFGIIHDFARDALELDELEKAKSAIERLDQVKKNPGQFIMPYLYYLTESDQYELALEEVEKAIEQYPAHRTKFLLKKASILFDPAFLKSQEGIDTALNFAEKVYEEFPDVVNVKAHLAKVYIFCKIKDKALKLIETFPTHLRRNYALDQLRAWRYRELGQFDKAYEIWDRLVKERDIVALFSPITDFRTLKDGVQITDDDVVLFSVVRDEDYRIEAFLDYYRELGVTKFVFIDNDSSDRSLEIVMAQQDTLVYATTNTYNQSFNGMRWVNKLVKELTTDKNWCLYADVDEYLLYPDIETKKLPELFEYLDQNNYDAVRGFMLDVFDRESFEVELDENCPLNNELYFSNNYYLSGWEFSPYWRVSGGLRAQLYEGLNIILTKTPIIKGGGGIRFLASSHIVTPAKVADVTSLFVHFKYSSKFIDRAKVEADRKVHFKGARRFKLYWEKRNEFFRVLDRVESDPVFVRLEDSNQLEQLELLNRGNF